MRLGAITLSGFGSLNGLGADSDTLYDGTTISFIVEGDAACQGVSADDVRDTLNSWASQMIHIDYVDASNWNLLPFYTNTFSVSATVLGDHSAGSIRSQIQSALRSLSSRCAGTISLQNNVITFSGGSGGGGTPGGSFAEDEKQKCVSHGGEWDTARGLCLEPEGWMKYLPWIVGGVAVLVVLPPILSRR